MYDRTVSGDESWWEQFSSEIVDGAWTAVLLQGALATLLAFAGAWLLFRRQLAHDRRLADQQRVADREERLAARRAVAADAFGRQLLTHSTAFDSIKPRDLGASLRASRDRKEWENIFGERDDAALVLDIDHTANDLAWNLLYTWEACHDAAASEEFPTVSDLTLGAALSFHMNPELEHLATYARALVRWDGVGPVPSREVLPESWEPVRIRDHAAYAAWGDQSAHSFTALAVKLEEKFRGAREVRRGKSP